MHTVLRALAVSAIVAVVTPAFAADKPGAKGWYRNVYVFDKQ